MPLKRKIVTITFLSLGFIVIAIGIARLIWLLNAFKGNVNSYSVESAYSAIESSVAIIGTSGPTVKYMLSRFIPWLRPSFERSTTTKNSNTAYGNNSSSNARPRRSQYNTDAEYDDLDSISAKHEDIEMKNDWPLQPRRDDDARSDEQRINEDPRGIVKSVEWTVHSAEQLPRGLRATSREPSGVPEASPKQIV